MAVSEAIPEPSRPQVVSGKLVSGELQEAEAGLGWWSSSKGRGMTKGQTEEKSRRRAEGVCHDWERGTWRGPVSGSCRQRRRKAGLWRRLG